MKVQTETHRQRALRAGPLSSPGALIDLRRANPTILPGPCHSLCAACGNRLGPGDVVSSSEHERELTWNRAAHTGAPLTMTVRETLYRCACGHEQVSCCRVGETCGA
jgi:hypothetical protein